MPGSNASNPDWARRKANVVKRFPEKHLSHGAEQQRPDRAFKLGEGLDITDYVLAGGGFPVTVKGRRRHRRHRRVGPAGREDHGVVVDAICEHLGVDRRGLALPAEVE